MPFLGIVVAVVALALLLNGWPFVVSLVGFSTASAIDPGPPSRTELVRLEPAHAPASKPGVCAGPSSFVPRSDAWHCEVEGMVHDPCFEAHEPNQPARIVCGADPLAGVAGFTVESATAPARAPSSRVDPATLSDLYYLIDRIGTPVKLVKGQYYAPYVESIGQGMLVALSGMRASGDLDGDGDDDTAVLLVADAGDDRMFIYLGAVINEGGQPSRTTTTELGDRVKVDHLAIRGGQIVVSLTTHDGDDPQCCPTLNAVWSYTLMGETLYRYVDGWRLELPGGIQCVPVQAAQAVEALGVAEGNAMPFAYQCGDGTWLRNGLRPGQVWYAERAAQPYTTVGDSVRPGQARSPFVPIVRLWQ
jgi:hypothetical protein